MYNVCIMNMHMPVGINALLAVCYLYMHVTHVCVDECIYTYV